MIKKVVGNVEVKVKHIGEVESDWVAGEWVNKYSVVCTNLDTKVQISYPFYGSVYDYYNNPPEFNRLMDSVLEILKSDYYFDEDMYPTFDSFVGDFGYDADDKKSKKIYRNVVQLAKKLQKVFDECVIESIEV